MCGVFNTGGNLQSIYNTVIVSYYSASLAITALL